MSADKEYTYSDVSEHTTKKDLFVVIHDKVYNASSFVDEHPYVLPLLAHSAFGPETVTFEGTLLVEEGLVILWFAEI